MVDPVVGAMTAPPSVPMTRAQRHNLLRCFTAEGRHRRKLFREQLNQEWESHIAPAFDQENDVPGQALMDEEIAYDSMVAQRLALYDSDYELKKSEFLDELSGASLAGSLFPDGVSAERITDSSPDALLQRRTAELWAGLRRVYFGEDEGPGSGDFIFDQSSAKRRRTQESDAEYRRELGNTLLRFRRPSPVPEDLNAPSPPILFPHSDDDDEETQGGISQSALVVLPADALTPDRVSPGPPPTTENSSSRNSPRRLILSIKQLRRVLTARETLFKFGIFVPKNDREANASPEAHRWKAGRDLEWLRLNEQGTFEQDWTLSRMAKEYPLYKREDIGHLFYVYDFKYSGEHRVRLVFDGSRQGISTYKETYAPTARQESVRLFHVVLVEENWGLGQYDVPQAFLKALIDYVIFAHPPKGQAAFPGQILRLKRALYGGKQSAYLWFTLINEFVLSLGFVASPLDSCFYRKSDAILILFCDDLRIGASDLVLQGLHKAFYDKFGITTASGDRFLGMDTFYDRPRGFLKISMASYIANTVERFESFDLSRGFPFREIVGCLLWITLCVMGPELLRAKDLARRSNSYGEEDYFAALDVLRRISLRREHGIVIRRGGAGREIVPSNSRQPISEVSDDTGSLISEDLNELRYQSLSGAQKVTAASSYLVADPDALDLATVSLPVNPRYSLVAYGDASFATGETKQSVSGFVLYLNGVPILWGSLKQTIVVDSSCSAEFVAASVVCKQILHAENMIAFLGFTCPKPYRLYTDSSACLHIATNPSRLGNVRHLQIRYHLVRCYVTLGQVEMVFCVTEEMVADLFTKLVVLAQDTRLTVRFYTLIPDSFSMALSDDFKKL
jgi:hypothetical protein